MNIIHKKKRNKINTFKKPDGEMTDPGKETLISAHFPSAVNKIRQHYSSENKYGKQEIEDSNADWINFTLTIEALTSFKKKKSPGPDGLKAIIFEHLPDNFIRHLVFI